MGCEIAAMVHCCGQKSPWATPLACHTYMCTRAHTHTHTIQLARLSTSGEKGIFRIILIVIQALPSFSGTGQTEVGWSASAAEKSIKMKLPSGMCLFLFPMGQEEEAIHAVELGQCCGLAHDKQEREQVSPSG